VLVEYTLLIKDMVEMTFNHIIKVCALSNNGESKRLGDLRQGKKGFDLPSHTSHR
jgi:hypothetical protein